MFKIQTKKVSLLIIIVYKLYFGSYLNLAETETEISVPVNISAGTGTEPNLGRSLLVNNGYKFWVPRVHKSLTVNTKKWPSFLLHGSVFLP